MKKNVKRAACLLAASVLAVTAVPAVAHAEEDVTIYFLSNSTTDTQIDFYTETAEKYHELNPNVTVEFQSGGTEYYSVLKTKINAGETPDIFMTMGYKDVEVYKDYLYDMNDDADLKAVYDSLFESCKQAPLTSDGKIGGIPTVYEGYGYVYNKDLFAQAGIETLPTTYDEMVAVCEKLTESGITPFANGYSEWWIMKHSFAPFIGASFESDPAMKEALLGGTQFADLEYIDEMFQWADLTMEYGLDKSLETDASTVCALFAAGKAAMMNQGTWVYSSCKEMNPDLNLGFINPPVGNDPAQALLSTDCASVYGISADTKHFEEAKGFLLYMIERLSTEGDGGDLIPIQGLDADTVTGGNVLISDVVTASDSGLTRGWTANHWVDGFEMEFGAAIQEYCGGIKTQEETIAAIQSAWDKLAQ